MLRIRVVAVGLAILLVAVSPAPASAAASKGGKDKGPGAASVMTIKREGEAFCFAGAIVSGSVLIAGGRCYTFYLLRTSAGLFLGFGPPGPPMIPRGQIVRIGTPAGQKMKGRLFYLVPVQAPVAIIQLDTILFVPVLVTPRPGQVVITVPTATAGSTQVRPIEMTFFQR